MMLNVFLPRWQIHVLFPQRAHRFPLLVPTKVRGPDGKMKFAVVSMRNREERWAIQV